MASAPKAARQFQGIFDVIPFKATVDFGSVGDDAEDAANITVPGAALGDLVLIAPGVDVTDGQLTATVTAANTVTAVFSNVTGGAINLASQTLTGVVLSPKGVFDSL
jgi:hypothetical protein